MIWIGIVRAATVVSLAAAILNLYDLYTREVKPNRIYSPWQAARYLGVDRRYVIRLVEENKLRGKLVRGNYLIAGRSILEYLNQ